MRVQVKKMSQARRKQLAVALIALSALLMVVALAVFMIESNKTKANEEIKVQNKQQITATDFTSPQSVVSEQVLWTNTEGAKVEDLNRRYAELEQRLKQYEAQAASNAKNRESPDGLGVPNEPLGDVSPLSNPPTNNIPAPPSNQLPLDNGNNQAGQNANVAPPRTNRIKSLNMDDVADSGSENNDNKSDNAISESESGTSAVRRSADFKQSEEWARVKAPRMNIEVIEDGGEVINSTVSRGKFRARDSYIPSGTFFRSVLLGGVDAPTGGEAQNASPHPVLMRVTDFAQMPNQFKYNFRECFVTGQAYGDISAERAYIRLQNLSCVGTDGRAIDMPVRGYVAGEDGKTGVRGSVVTKQGQVLANALFAGILSGLGQGVSQSFNVTNDTPFGTTTSVGGANQYKAGIATGVGNAADRLAQYYIKLADKVFPVVEINAGRTVDIVLTQGIEIDTSETK